MTLLILSATYVSSIQPRIDSIMRYSINSFAKILIPVDGVSPFLTGARSSIKST